MRILCSLPVVLLLSQSQAFIVPKTNTKQHSTTAQYVAQKYSLKSLGLLDPAEKRRREAQRAEIEESIAKAEREREEIESKIKSSDAALQDVQKKVDEILAYKKESERKSMDLKSEQLRLEEEQSKLLELTKRAQSELGAKKKVLQENRAVLAKKEKELDEYKALMNPPLAEEASIILGVGVSGVAILAALRMGMEERDEVYEERQRALKASEGNEVPSSFEQQQRNRDSPNGMRQGQNDGFFRPPMGPPAAGSRTRADTSTTMGSSGVNGQSPRPPQTLATQSRGQPPPSPYFSDQQRKSESQSTNGPSSTARERRADTSSSSSSSMSDSRDQQGRPSFSGPSTSSSTRNRQPLMGNNASAGRPPVMAERNATTVDSPNSFNQPRPNERNAERMNTFNQARNDQRRPSERDERLKAFNQRNNDREDRPNVFNQPRPNERNVERMNTFDQQKNGRNERPGVFNQRSSDSEERPSAFNPFKQRNNEKSRPSASSDNQRSTVQPSTSLNSQKVKEGDRVETLRGPGLVLDVRERDGLVSVELEGSRTITYIKLGDVRVIPRKVDPVSLYNPTQQPREIQPRAEQIRNLPSVNRQPAPSSASRQSTSTSTTRQQSMRASTQVQNTLSPAPTSQRAVGTGPPPKLQVGDRVDTRNGPGLILDIREEQGLIVVELEKMQRTGYYGLKDIGEKLPPRVDPLSLYNSY